MDDPHVPSHYIDRLSELPNSLALEILSLLKMKDVVRTTILSKRWKDFWTTVPCLDFGDANRRFIEAALAKWKGMKILKFRIGFLEDGDAPATDIVDSWLLLTIEKQVQKLSVYMRQCMYPRYCPTQRLLSCSSITKLSLHHFELKIEENVNVQWNQLKRLKIKYPSYLSQDALNRILSGAPVLEELILCIWKISENLTIQSTSLKMLYIGRDNRGFIGRVNVVKAVLAIGAPNLLTLEISAFLFGNCLLDVPSLTKALLHFQMHDYELVFGSPIENYNHVFRSICHVEKLTLSAWCTKYFLVYLENKNMAVPFSKARSLKFSTAEAGEMLNVLEMFPDLMMLQVKLEQDYVHALSAEVIHAAMVDACNSSATEMTLPSPSLLQLKTIDILWSIQYPLLGIISK